MIKVLILTLLIEGNNSGELFSQIYNYTTHNECEVAVQFQKRTLEKKGGILQVNYSCFIGYIVK